MKAIDLFAGTGGFTLGLKGICKTIYANDNDEYSKKIYTHNFPNVEFDSRSILDITKLPKCDIITAGFPCQSFSVSGHQLGLKDKRAKVIWKLIDLISKTKPRFVLLENVKHLLFHDKGKSFEIIKEKLENIGYKLKYKIYNTKNFGIQQNRERIYIMCFKNEKDYEKFTFSDVSITEYKNILEKKVERKYYYSSRYKIWDLVKESVCEKGYFYQFRRVYVRKNEKKICPTLTANMGSGGHNVPLILDNKGIRKLTPRECFNLQGFPISYELIGTDSRLYKLCGNAISVCVVKQIGKDIKKFIFSKE